MDASEENSGAEPRYRAVAVAIHRRILRRLHKKIAFVDDEYDSTSMTAPGKTERR